MEYAEIKIRQIRTIPKHRFSQLSRGEWAGLIGVAALGLTGVLGATVVAWWLVFQ